MRREVVVSPFGDQVLAAADTACHGAEYQGLRVELQAAHDASGLPKTPDEATQRALNDLLSSVCLESWALPAA